MTIKRKNVGTDGLVEAEADPTDTVDTGGDSDAITTGTGAITAEYSGGGEIQASTGLRVGTTQIKIIGGTEHLPAQILESSDWGNGANIVDGDLDTVSSTNSSVLPTVIEVVVDFSSIASRTIGTKFNVAQTSNLSTTLFTRFTSRIYISDTTTFGAQEASQVNTVQGTNTGAQNSDFTQDLTSRSYRYVKFTMEQETTNVPTGQRTGRCSVYSVNIQLVTSTDAVIDIRASDSIDTADGDIIRGSVTVAPDTTVAIDDDLLLVESEQYLTLAVNTVSANLYDLTLSEITSITEV